MFLTAQCNRGMVLAIVMISASNFVVARNQHLICKSVSDVFTESTDGPYDSMNITGMGRVQGKPGKRGPVGPPGVPGPRGLMGEQGIVDYNNISQIVERKVCEGLREVASRLHQMESNFLDLRLSLREMTCGTADLLYNGTCYSTPHFTTSNDLSFAKANETCRKLGLKLAEIHDRSQQLILKDFILSKKSPTLGYMSLWIGMKYDPTTKMITYESGKRVAGDHLIWWSPYRSTTRGFVNMVLGVDIGNSRGHGLWNYNEYNRRGVICERKI